MYEGQVAYAVQLHVLSALQQILLLRYARLLFPAAWPLWPRADFWNLSHAVGARAGVRGLSTALGVASEFNASEVEVDILSTASSVPRKFLDVGPTSWRFQA